MTRQTNRCLIEAFVIDRRADLLTDDIVFRDQAQERSFAGRALAEAVWQAFFADGFAEVRIEIHMLIADDTAAALEFTFRGRHQGRFMGIPPTGREVVIPMALFCWIEAREIRQASLYYNAGTLLRQLGLAL